MDFGEVGVVYVGRDGSERLLVERGRMFDRKFVIDNQTGDTFRWRRPNGKAVRECWVSTWMEWAKVRKEAAP